jgi:hypothetical protein
MVELFLPCLVRRSRLLRYLLPVLVNRAFLCTLTDRAYAAQAGKPSDEQRSDTYPIEVYPDGH